MVGELHDIFDEVEGLVVHVVGVDLVAHQLCSTPADGEQYDSLHKWTVDIVGRVDFREAFKSPSNGKNPLRGGNPLFR